MKLEHTFTAEEKKVILPYTPTREYEVESVGDLPRKPVYELVKRCFDVALSAFLLLLLAIPMMVIGIAVKLTSPGPALYTQERLGKDGKQIKICKFRTMISDSEIDTIRWSCDEDPRVTPLGRILRKYHIDELPQLWNIFRGDMSIVGPRPPLTYHPWPVDQYTEEQFHMFDVRPGLTGWAQVHGRKAVEWHKRIEMNVWYTRYYSLWLDVKILFMTVFKVLSNADNVNDGATLK